MKKIKLSLIALLGLPTLMLAQDLYVSPSSYMYVQDEIVFVTDDIRLEAADSNIYLRDGAQLIQDSDTKNSDAGELSVYQNQVNDIYSYSYWCSPTGVSADGTTAENVDFNVTNFHQPASLAINEINSITYDVSPSGYNSTASQIKTYWLWQVLNAYSYGQWSHVTNTGNVQTGRGFTMKGSPTANNTIDFRGRPNTGTITAPCVWSGTTAQTDYDGLLSSQVESLIGNPYPSSMDLKLLFMDASAPHAFNKNIFLEKAVYFWEGNDAVSSHYLADYEGGYATYIPGNVTDLADDGSYIRATWKRFHIGGNGGGTGSNNGGGVGFSTNYLNHNRRYAAIGQGFMVRNIDGNVGGNVVIDNSMRVYIKQDNAFNGDGAIFNKTASSPESNNSPEGDVIAMSHNGIDYHNIVNNPTIIPEIRIQTLINDLYYRENLLAFRNNTDLSFKAGCDARIAHKLATDTYFIADNNELSIKSITYDIDAKLPFGIVAENNTTVYEITIETLKDVSDSVEVFMHDKLNDTYTDIRNGTFEITLDTGTYNDRFEVVFRDASKEANDELLITEAEITGSFDVFQNNTNNQLVIKNPKSYIVKSFTMYDVTGKLIYNKHNLGNDTEYTFPTNTLSSGTYITKITTDQNFEITKKIIINN
ncbi:MAG: T9SS type A sorting domain-containing protein [Flavobacteriaceae bacterium]|nr:T9SS type A sorting domain-containing protein [Flavobacteriaceae bacterium]